MQKPNKTAERLLEQQAGQVLVMFRQGRSVYFLADHFSVRVGDVRRFLRARGETLPGKGVKGDRGHNVHVSKGKRPRDATAPADEISQLLIRWRRVA